jgi:ABC-type multidrug transport system fused ATPase/permease subunit
LRKVYLFDKYKYIIYLLGFLRSKERHKLVRLTIGQILLSVLDLVGLFLIGLLGALVISGVQSKNPIDSVVKLLNLLKLNELSFQAQSAILAVLSTTFFVLRTLLSVYFTRKTLYLLSESASFISNHLLVELLKKPLSEIKTISSLRIVNAVTHGTVALTVGIIASGVSIISDLAIILLLTIGLFVINPIIAIGTLVLFALIAIILDTLIRKKAVILGKSSTDLEVKSNLKIIETLEFYRELKVRNKIEEFTKEVYELRSMNAKVIAETRFLPNISKYVIEASVILGALILCSIQFLLQDAINAVSAISVFLAAGSRTAPAVLRLQQSLIQIRVNNGIAHETMYLQSVLETQSGNKLTTKKVSTNSLNTFLPLIELENVTFTYPDSNFPAIENITITINQNEYLAIVGSSGSGKSTLVDLILGINKPSFGRVNLSGTSPDYAFQKWPGKIGYVPQKVSLIKGTLRENILMGESSKEFPDSKILDAISDASLDATVGEMPMGLDTLIGDGYQNLSGGQIQRVGIARSLLTDPEIIIFDEATSSLDSQTENEITSVIREFKNKKTLIVIAHRLSTILNASKIVYMEKGKIISLGTLNEIRNGVPEFDLELKKMGI